MSLIKVQRSNKPERNVIILGDVRGPLRGFRIVTDNLSLNPSAFDSQLDSVLEEVAKRAYEEGKQDA